MYFPRISGIWWVGLQIIEYYFSKSKTELRILWTSPFMNFFAAAYNHDWSTSQYCLKSKITLSSRSHSPTLTSQGGITHLNCLNLTQFTGNCISIIWQWNNICPPRRIQHPAGLRKRTLIWILGLKIPVLLRKS